MSLPRARSAATSSHTASASSPHAPSATPLDLRREFLRRAAESLAVSSPPVAAHLGRCVQLLTPAPALLQQRQQGQAEAGRGGVGAGSAGGGGSGQSVSKAMAVDGSVLCAGCGLPQITSLCLLPSFLTPARISCGLPQILPSTCTLTIASYPRIGNQKRRAKKSKSSQSTKTGSSGKTTRLVASPVVVTCGNASGSAVDASCAGAVGADAAAAAPLVLSGATRRSATCNQVAGEGASTDAAAATAAAAAAASVAATAAATAAGGVATAGGSARKETGERRKGGRKRRRKARGRGQVMKGGEEQEKRRRVAQEGVQRAEGKQGEAGGRGEAVSGAVHRNRISHDTLLPLLGRVGCCCCPSYHSTPHSFHCATASPPPQPFTWASQRAVCSAEAICRTSTCCPPAMRPSSVSRCSFPFPPASSISLWFGFI
ncbi:unnamed protein product [Closterium sp. NIES-54]